MKFWHFGFTKSRKNAVKEANMFYRLTGVVLLVAVLVCSITAYGQEVSREQIKGLDEQVQDIKSDVLAIAAQLNQLEEKLLYPSNTQVAIFVSLNDGENFQLDSIEILLDGRPVARHIYTFKELEALQKGGVQRIYTGNVTAGDHDLQVSVMVKSGAAADSLNTEHFTVNKGVGPKIVDISLAAQDIAIKDM